MNSETRSILEKCRGSITLLIDGKTLQYDCGKTAIEELGGGYCDHKITSIITENNSTVFSLKKVKDIPNYLHADWVKDHVTQYGREPDIFDGI